MTVVGKPKGSTPGIRGTKGLDLMSDFLLMLCAIIILFMSISPKPPRLIGIGCEGSGGDIFAFEESDFPTRCQKIEEYR